MSGIIKVESINDIIAINVIVTEEVSRDILQILVEGSIEYVDYVDLKIANKELNDKITVIANANALEECLEMTAFIEYKEKIISALIGPIVIATEYQNEDRETQTVPLKDEELWQVVQRLQDILKTNSAVVFDLK